MNWVDSFVESTEHITSPLLFRKWAGICAVAGALERKVWVRTYGSNLYPNMYTVLVGPPGVGKTEVTWRVQSLWHSLEDHVVASSSVTKASLIDELSKANRRLVNPTANPPVVQFNSLLICANELGVLIPSYENDFMNTLTDIYDCKTYSETRRTKDLNIKVEHPQINLLAACTPSYLNHVLPEGAWDQGFLSRVLLIYSGEQQIRGLFDEEATNGELQKELKEGLDHIGSLYGKMSFTEEAAVHINNWHLAKGPPRPDHPKLHNYCSRRTPHALKLAMVACAAEGDTLVITKEHVTQALDWLVEAEFYMPDIFKSMTSGGDSKVIEETWYFAYTTYMKEGKKAIAASRLIFFLQERTPAHNITRILEVMCNAGMLKEVLEKTGTGYIPQGKQ